MVIHWVIFDNSLFSCNFSFNAQQCCTFAWFTIFTQTSVKNWATYSPYQILRFGYVYSIVVTKVASRLLTTGIAAMLHSGFTKKTGSDALMCIKYVSSSVEQHVSTWDYRNQQKNKEGSPGFGF